MICVWDMYFGYVSGICVWDICPKCVSGICVYGYVYELCV